METPKIMDYQFDIDAGTIALELDSFQQFFGFRTHPFASSIDGANAILLADQTVARDAVVKAIKNQDEIIVLSGPIGIGKTIVIDNVIAIINDKFQTIKLSATDLNHDNMFNIIKRTFGNQQHIRFIIEDAGLLSVKTLKAFIAFLTIIKEKKIVQVIFVGRTHIWNVLGNIELKSFHDLINAKISLNPMDESIIQEYMAMRLNLAGLSSVQVMTPRAVKAISRASHGNPGRLNGLAVGSLKNAMFNKHKRVTYEDATLAIKSPNVSPAIAYSWVRLHRKPILIGFATVAILSAGIFGITRSSFPPIIISTRLIVADVIDFFADHSSQESPQIRNVDKVEITTGNVVDEDESVQRQRHLLDMRAQLLAKLDRESRAREEAYNISQLPPIINNEKPITVPLTIAPISQPDKLDKVEEPSTIDAKPSELTKSVEDAHEVKIATPMVNEVPPPVLQAATPIPNPTSTREQPPITEPMVTPPESVQTQSEKTPPKLDVEQSPSITPIKHNTSIIPRVHEKSIVNQSISKLPAFCSRMDPSTEAGKAYMKRVCVVENTKGDIYYQHH